MAAALAVPPAPAPSIPTKHMTTKTHSCPKCGSRSEIAEPLSEEAQRKITELEMEVELLKEKATAAVDKCADFEDQIRTMKGLARSDTTNSLQPNGRMSGEEARPGTANSASAKQSRFSFLTARRGSPATPDVELLEQLEKERALRAKAEERARTVDNEIEELSVQLFSQANDMVATERKARAKLEARIEQLEKKEKEKAARLERLESAVGRIDRVKALLAAPTQAPAAVPTKN